MKKLLYLVAFVPALCFGTIHYISPNGNDGNGGTGCSADAFLTFDTAFGAMSANDELVLCDTATAGGFTTYAEGTVGSIDDVTNTNEIPNGTGGNFTVIRSTDPLKVHVTSGLQLGTNTSKRSYVYISSISFIGERSQLRNTDHVKLTYCGFNSDGETASTILVIGSNDHNYGNTYDLVEDCWVWGKERIILQTYRAANIIFRRVVIRQDGCYTEDIIGHSGECSDDGNSMVGYTTYNSTGVIVENVISLDGLLGDYGIAGAADFQTAYHSSSGNWFGYNEWLGTISLNSELQNYLMEVDDLVVSEPTWTLNNVVGIDGTLGFNASAKANVEQKTLVVTNGTFKQSKTAANDVFRIGPNNIVGSVTNVISFTTGTVRSYMNSAIQATYVDTAGGAFTEGRYDQTTPVTGVFTSTPTADGSPASLMYPTRIETGSALKGQGADGADIGANVIYAYGNDGTFYGDADYDTLTAVDLWPWRNEAAIFQQMCTETGETRGFCGSTSITEYIWEYLGNEYTPNLDTISVSSPTADETVTGTYVFISTPVSPTGIAGVTFKVDTIQIGEEVTVPPYELSYDTTLLTNGAHSVTATLRNTSEEETVSDGISFTVDNPVSAGKLSIRGGNLTIRGGNLTIH